MSALAVDNLSLSQTYRFPASGVGRTLAKKSIFAFSAIIII